jgi:BRCA1-associated protein
MSIYTGKMFSVDQDRMETCHPIRVHHLILHTVTDNTTPVSTVMPSLLSGIAPKSIHELPTCPVCLERMDSVVTGLITPPCSHVFHCKCLSKWGGSNCPVCHLSHRTRELDSKPPFSRCTPCSEEKNDPKANWVCIICGYIGCSRYQQGHARDHYLRTGHVHSMEIDTQRVWDYVEDT